MDSQRQGGGAMSASTWSIRDADKLEKYRDMRMKNEQQSASEMISPARILGQPSMARPNARGFQQQSAAISNNSPLR